MTVRQDKSTPTARARYRFRDIEMLKKAAVLKDTSGNFGMAFAILSVPVMLAGGLAVDYVGLSVQKRELQNATDAAALAVAREGNVTGQQAVEIARQIVAANYGFTAAQITATSEDGVASVNASIDKPLVFGGLMSKTSMLVDATSEATYASTKYEIALVLDTTNSMLGGKLVTLQNAIIGLVEDIEGLGLAKDQVKIALVPYSGFVNVGPEFGPVINGGGKVKTPAADWLDQDAKAPIPQSDLPSEFSRFAMFRHLKVDWPGCVETRVPNGSALHDVYDTVPDPADKQSLFTPFFAVDEPDIPLLYANSYLADSGLPLIGKGATETDKEDQLARYGRTGKYVKPKDTDDAIVQVMKWKKPKTDFSPSSTLSIRSAPKGPGFGCEAEPLVTLTTDFTEIKASVKNLTASGTNNMLEGVMWGWRVLSSREPFTEGAAEGSSGVERIMIFVSDGQNSFGNLSNLMGSGYTSMGYLVDGRLDGITAASSGQTATALDKKTLAACTNAKEDGIEIYTVRLEKPIVSTETVLSECASTVITHPLAMHHNV